VSSPVWRYRKIGAYASRQSAKHWRHLKRNTSVASCADCRYREQLTQKEAQ
jgi:hypothetical protein